MCHDLGINLFSIGIFFQMHVLFLFVGNIIIMYNDWIIQNLDVSEQNTYIPLLKYYIILLYHHLLSINHVKNTICTI